MSSHNLLDISHKLDYLTARNHLLKGIYKDPKSLPTLDKPKVLTALNNPSLKFSGRPKKHEEYLHSERRHWKDSYRFSSKRKSCDIGIPKAKETFT